MCTERNAHSLLVLLIFLESDNLLDSDYFLSKLSMERCGHVV